MNPLRRAAPWLALAAVLCSPAAQALTLMETQANGATVDTSFSTPDVIAADLGFPFAGAGGVLAVTLRFALDADDLSRGSARLNGIVNNLSSPALASLRVSVDQGTLTPGSVVSNDGPGTVTTPSAGEVNIAFTAPLESFVELGDPIGDGRQDWVVGFGGLGSGDTVAVTWTVTAVPEPGTWLLLAGGLGLLGAVTRRPRHGRG